MEQVSSASGIPHHFYCVVFRSKHSDPSSGLGMHQADSHKFFHLIFPHPSPPLPLFLTFVLKNMHAIRNPWDPPDRCCQQNRLSSAGTKGEYEPAVWFSGLSLEKNYHVSKITGAKTGDDSPLSQDISRAPQSSACLNLGRGF